MKKILKIIGAFLLLILAILLVLSSIYVFKHYPRKITSFEINNPELTNRILIASQGSDFKNALLDNIIEKIENDSTYIKIVNISELDNFNDMDWQSIIIINTCIANSINKDLELYLEKSKNTEDTFLVITAGDGRWYPENLNVDAISTASRISYIERISNEVLIKIFD